MLNFDTEVGKIENKIRIKTDKINNSIVFDFVFGIFSCFYDKVSSYFKRNDEVYEKIFDKENKSFVIESSLEQVSPIIYLLYKRLLEYLYHYSFRREIVFSINKSDFYLAFTNKYMF